MPQHTPSLLAGNGPCLPVRSQDCLSASLLQALPRGRIAREMSGSSRLVKIQVRSYGTEVVAVAVGVIQGASAGVVDLGGPMAVAIVAQWHCDVDNVAALTSVGRSELRPPADHRVVRDLATLATFTPSARPTAINAATIVVAVEGSLLFSCLR